MSDLTANERVCRCGKSLASKRTNGCHTIGCTFGDASSSKPEVAITADSPDLIPFLRHDECDELCAHPCLKSRAIRNAGADLIERLQQRVAELERQDEVHWKTRRSLLRRIEQPKPINHDLWRHLHEEHGLTLLQSELDEIVRLSQPPEDRLDSERYRWLRMHVAPTILSRLLGTPREGIVDGRPEALDAWLDKRLSQTKTEHPAVEQSAANSEQCVSRKAAQSGTAAGSSDETSVCGGCGIPLPLKPGTAHWSGCKHSESEDVSR